MLCPALKYSLLTRGSDCLRIITLSLECATISSERIMTGCRNRSDISKALIVRSYVSCAEKGARTILS